MLRGSLNPCLGVELYVGLGFPITMLLYAFLMNVQNYPPIVDNQTNHIIQLANCVHKSFLILFDEYGELFVGTDSATSAISSNGNHW